jgi:hypothetical protein
MPLSGSIPELPHVAKLSLRLRLNRDSVDQDYDSRGTAELGSCPTDATHEGRSRRAVRNLPLCQRPNACVGNHRGTLARWHHTIPPCLTYNNKLSSDLGCVH